MTILVSTVMPLTGTSSLGYTGKVVSPRAALNRALAEGRHLGKFDNHRNADRYSDRLHLQQERIYRCG